MKEKKLFPPLLSWLLLMVVLFATGRITRAAETDIIQSPTRIAVGQTQKFNLGAIARTGTVLLRIDSRLDAKGLGGSMFFMDIRMNGQKVLPAKSRTAVRLVNKPMNTAVTAGVSGPWYDARGGWRAIYAPDFKAALTQPFYADNPYVIVLDVTDLIDPKTDNELEITNTATASAKAYSGTAAELVIEKLSVETRATPSPMTEPIADLPDVVNQGTPTRAATYHGKILPGGGFAIQVGKNTFRFSSAFSYPNAGFNSFAAGTSSSGQSGWRVRIDAKSGSVMAQGPDYRIKRTIKFEKNRAEITDSITNLHRDTPLGLAVRNEMDLNGLPASQIRLAGNPDPTVNDYYAPGNPSVHIRLPQNGIGIIAEDDVFRNQARLYVNPARGGAPAVAGVHTEMLRLAAGETYALRWAVYAVDGPDYYDFVNLVRQDWKTNITTPGAWWWGFLPDTILEMPLPELHDLLVKNGIRYANFDGGWIDRQNNIPRIGFGAGVFDAEWASYRQRIRAASEKLHQALPGIKVLGYYDIQQDTSENSPQKFADSWLTNSHGDQISATWSDERGEWNRFYGVVPTLTNSFGKAAQSTAERYMDELKLDGLYWDEMENITYGIPRVTYNIFDSHSCLLDTKTWTIQREIGIAPLLSASFRKAVIQSIQKRGGVILGNTPSGILSEQHTGIMRMVEIQGDNANHYQGNLETPLGYIGTRNSWKDFLRALNYAMLPVVIMPRARKTYYYYQSLGHDIMPYLFPFTPIELHAGYLLGQERIIVTHDGDYGWNGMNTLALTRHFDDTGKLTATHFPIVCTLHDARTPVQLESDEAAVLEKIPVSLISRTKTPPTWKALATVMQYDPNVLTVEIKASQGGTLIVKNGILPLKDGQRLKVSYQTKNAPQAMQSVAVKNGTVTVPIPDGFEGSCTLSPAT